MILLSFGPLDLTPVACGTPFYAITGALFSVTEAAALVALTLVGLLLHGSKYRPPEQSALISASVRE